ncbi:MAG: 50S ribosomal protein L15 [Kosmotogaceae bacterium]
MAFTLDQLKPTPGSRRKAKRLGHGVGSGRGKTSGRGHKGQGRGTGKVRSFFEGGQTPLYRRVPVKGFKNRHATRYSVTNVAMLEKYFEDGEEVTAEKLKGKNIIRKYNDGVKILGKGELTKKLIVKVNAFSASAKQKIEAAGGKAEVV